MILLPHRKMMKIPRWRKVLHTHRKFTEVDRWSRGCIESLGMVPWPCGKLTEGPVARRKVGGKSRGRMKGWQKVPQLQGKLTEGPAAARKVDESWQNVLYMQRKLKEIDGRPYWRRKSWWKDTQIQGKLTKVVEGPVDVWKVQGIDHGRTKSLWKITTSNGWT